MNTLIVGWALGVLSLYVVARFATWRKRRRARQHLRELASSLDRFFDEMKASVDAANRAVEEKSTRH